MPVQLNPNKKFIKLRKEKSWKGVSPPLRSPSKSAEVPSEASLPINVSIIWIIKITELGIATIQNPFKRVSKLLKTSNIVYRFYGYYRIDLGSTPVLIIAWRISVKVFRFAFPFTISKLFPFLRK